MLRTVLQEDGLVIREMVRLLASSETIRRDDVARALPDIIHRAVDAAEALGVPRQFVVNGRKFVRSLNESASRAGSAGPGVLEHRTSPRLEWLVDLGYLVKDGDIPKNAFEYRVTDNIAALLKTLDESVAPGVDWPLYATSRLGVLIRIGMHCAAKCRQGTTARP